jgi:hypothetical protein
MKDLHVKWIRRLRRRDWERAGKTPKSQSDFGVLPALKIYFAPYRGLDFRNLEDFGNLPSQVMEAAGDVLSP